MNDTTAGTQDQALYGADLYTWAIEQAALLRAGLLEKADLENIAEEIESLGRNEFDKLTSNLAVILMHLLKWDHQPGMRTRSWALSIAAHRARAEDVLEDNPGLKSRWDEAVARAYRRARIDAAKETGIALKVFPTNCAYDRAAIFTRSLTDEQFNR
jgi:Domain of unknown function DUF29